MYFEEITETSQVWQKINIKLHKFSLVAAELFEYHIDSDNLGSSVLFRVTYHKLLQAGPDEAGAGQICETE